MKRIALVLLAVAPVAKAPGLVVSEYDRLYVDGKRFAMGTQPAWSADGTQIAFVRDGKVFVARADGTEERPLTDRVQASSPAWSPDGKRLAFGGRRDVFVVRVADRRLTQLTYSAHPWLGNYTPAYSPDGKRIAFSRSTDAFNTDIFVMSANGNNLRRLTKTQGTDATLGEEHGPDWSPDGRTIVFVSNRDRSWELYTIDATGRRERRLTNTTSAHYNENSPRFSRDGKRILYTHDGHVATMNADGSGVRELGLGTSADWR
jgi:TolB protein